MKHNKKGTTLVEVILAFAALMLLIVVFQGAVSFSGRMIDVTLQRRADAAEAAALLRQGAPAQDVDEATYSFTVVGGTGTNVLFEVDTRRIVRTVTLSDGTECPFYQFAPKDGG